MAGKESEQQFVAINRDANVADNRDIQQFLPELRRAAKRTAEGVTSRPRPSRASATALAVVGRTARSVSRVR